MADEQLRQDAIKKQKKPVATPKASVPKAEKKVEKAEAKKEEKVESKAEAKVEEKKTDVKPDAKKEEKKPEVSKAPKRDEAHVYGRSLPISLKHSKGIGKFIKGKKIEDAINDLQEVVKMKKAVPMKGELAHRKGKMMSGKYPVKASEHFIRLLKTLNANSTMHGLDIGKTKIIETIPNKAPEQLHRFGSQKFKRTHITIKAKESKK